MAASLIRAAATSAEQRLVGAGHPGLRAQLSSASNRAARGAPRRDGRPPRRAAARARAALGGHEPRWASTSATSSAFCSPVEHCRPARPSASARLRSLRCGPRCAAGLASASALAPERRAAAPRPRRRRAPRATPSTSPSRPARAAGRARHRPAAGIEARDRHAARGGDRDAASAMRSSSAASQAGSAALGLEQALALAQACS